MLSYNRKIHLPYSSFLSCVLWEAFITWKTKSHALLWYVSIQITKQDFRGLCSYIATLLDALGETSEVRVIFSIQLRTCFGLCLLTLTLVSLRHSTGNGTPKHLMSVGCSALCSVLLHSCGGCLIRFTLGSVLKAQWATTAESASVALWRTWQQGPQHGPGKYLSVALLLSQLLP